MSEMYTRGENLVLRALAGAEAGELTLAELLVRIRPMSEVGTRRILTWLHGARLVEREPGGVAQLTSRGRAYCRGRGWLSDGRP